MKFDGKMYCYYTLINEIRMDEKKGSRVLELLGNFEIEPGSLKKTQRKVDYISDGIPALVSDSVVLGNNDFTCDSFLIDQIGGMEIKGRYGGNSARLIVESEDSDLNILIVASDGIHYFTTYEFSKSTSFYQSYYAFYDSDAFKVLQGSFGLGLQEIMKLTPESLRQLGFSPDDCFFADIEELGYDSKSDFVSSLLQKMDYSSFFHTMASVSAKNFAERHK